MNPDPVSLYNYALNNIPDYKNVTEIPQENLDYLNSGLVASTMNSMFDQCYELESIPRLNIDTSKCTDMAYMFRYCGQVANPKITMDLSWLDTSKVTTMIYMFMNSGLNGDIDLSHFDISNVTDMRYMFDMCDNLVSLDITGWDTSKVEDMRDMFSNCSNLETINGIIDMSGCRFYNFMFYGCPKLTKVKIKNPPDDFESETQLTSSQYEIVS